MYEPVLALATTMARVTMKPMTAPPTIARKAMTA
jgi:hypothetical protein